MRIMVIGMGRSGVPGADDSQARGRVEAGAESEPNRSLISTYRSYASPGTQIDSGPGPLSRPGPGPGYRRNR